MMFENDSFDDKAEISLRQGETLWGQSRQDLDMSAKYGRESFEALACQHRESRRARLDDRMTSFLWRGIASRLGFSAGDI